MIDIVLKYEGAEKFSNSLSTEIIILKIMDCMWN